MEISITNYPDHINEINTRYRLIELISNIAHNPPLREQHEDLINFDVRFHKFDPNQTRNRRNRFKPRTSANSDLLHGQVLKSWRLTFPISEFGQRFLYFVNANSPHRFGFTQKVQFAQATTNVGGKKMIGMPPPKLIHKLKTTLFTSQQEELAIETQLEKFAGEIFLASLEFGRLSGDDQISNDAPFRPEYQVIFFHDPRSTDPSTKDVATVTVDSSSSQITIHHSHRNSTKQLTVINTRTIKRVETDSLSVLLFLQCAPTFYQSSPINDQNDEPFARLVSLFSHQPPKSRESGFNDDHMRVMAFTSHLIKLRFPSENQMTRFLTKRHGLALPRVIHIERGVINTPVYTKNNLNQLHLINAKLDLSIAFQLDSLLYNLLLNTLQVIQLSQWVKDMDANLAERVLIRLVLDLSQDQVAQQHNQDHALLDDSLAHKFQLAIAKVKSKTKGTFDRKSPNQNLFMCRSVVITPTSFILEGPLPEQSNSILRLYDYNNSFIRVAIRDENGSTLQNDREVDSRGFLKKRYLPLLAEGLKIAGRKFDFLGYSSSALKCHQAWFVCPFTHNNQLMTASKIRERMGSFSKVNKIPARYMARIAQAFTTTEKAVTLHPSQLMMVPDVIRNGSVFTDGVGTISSSLARQVEGALLGRLMTLRRRSAVNSSCYQIRLGGYKGMISVDPTLPGEIVRLRPSMSKFDAQSYTLDIAGSFRRPLPAFLNRPLIKILEDLKIPSYVFLTEQRRTVRMIETSRESFRKSAKLMDRAGLGYSSRFPKILRCLGNLMRTDKTDDLGNTFIDDCLDLVTIDCLRDLKYRTRIPLESSYTLVGVADEEACLKEGEIYACIQEKGKSKEYLYGRIAISRSPSIHPGDVQVVLAIGRPPRGSEKLEAQVNCVVFSVLGERSLPSCLGGGDLDGDLYTLITNPSMIPKEQHLHTPASYAAPVMKSLPEPCTILDGIDFFLDYITSDLVGIIATRHMQIADQAASGTMHADCLKLADLHSKAVDYPKTGNPVLIQDLPKSLPAKPDFMCPEYMLGSKKGNDRYYESEKVLGQLFREIPSERVEFFEAGPLHGQLPQSIEGRGRRRRTEKVKMLDQDRKITNRIADVLNSYGISSFPDPIWIDEFRSLLDAFSQEFVNICRQSSLNKSKSSFAPSQLSEIEGVVGVILASISDRRLKNETAVRLREQTEELFATLRYEIIGEVEDIYDDDDADEEIMFDRLSLTDSRAPYVPNQTLVSRCLTAWHVAIHAEQDLFGVHSFGLTCLQILCNALRVQN